MKRLISLIVLATMGMTMLNTSGVKASVMLNEDISKSKANIDYEIYPLPQSEVYSDNIFTITDDVNVIIENGIDESTRNFTDEILDMKMLNKEYENKLVDDKTNIIIGIKGSEGYVDNYFNENIPYDNNIFNEEDSYVLKVDGELGKNGTIAILGKSTDSAYYGLATLKMILNQMNEKEIRSVTFEDFADAKWRGFIEGFYGYPWSHEDRMSLMEFGGQFKMNSYIFAPKDDPYHNSKWRDLYPEADLAKIKELVDVGNKSKTQFIWAIHPGFNMIKWNDYDNELKTLLNKLEQLYSIGVRQFGLFMDDINTDQGLKDTENHVKLITDVANWVESKGDCYSLVYCPPYYNQAWTGEKGKPYLRALANVPENVEIMWTGVDVCGTANAKEMEWVKEYIKRDSYMWLNWPVNGHNSARLMLGKGEVMEPGMHNVSGIVTNPLEYAELSKTALFAVADYTWNSDDFDDDKSWADSFKYITPEVAEEFHIIASHLSDPSPSSRNLVLEESEYIKEDLELFLNNFNNNEPLNDVGERLIKEFNKILNAIEVFNSDKNSNINMLEEINPWLNSLKYVVESCKSSVKSAIALQNLELNEAWTELSKATSYNETSKTFTTKKLNYPDVIVESGAKRLVPFENELISKLDSKIYMEMDPEASVRIPMTSYNSNDINFMVDGDDKTYSYFKIKQQVGDWYGIDLGKAINVNDVEIIQGRNDTDHDRFHRGILEYSLDGNTWTDIGKEREGIKITESNLNIKARYIRYRATYAGIPGGKPDLWTSVREFTVNKSDNKVTLYTNVAGLEDVSVNTTNTISEITNLKNITLKSSEYIGLKLLSIERISDIVSEISSKDILLETSINAIEWRAVDKKDKFDDARYIRLINKGKNEVAFDLDRLSVSLNKFVEPNIIHNYSGIYNGDIKNIFDGKLESKVWFSDAQNENKYVQLDLGGIIDVENISLVIGDSEKDYFREGNLQISLNGEMWQTIGSFNGGSREDNFPTHKAPYRYRKLDNINQQARYVRLISTKNSNAWFALNEIIINEGIESQTSGNPAFEVNPDGNVRNTVELVIDNKLSTFYTPKGDSNKGSLLYKLSDYTGVGELIILQGPTAISNGNIEIRDLDGWHKIGNLSSSYNSFNTNKFANVLDIRITWDGVKPIINEIITVKNEIDNIVIDKVKDIKVNNVTSNSVKLMWTEPNSTIGLVEYIIYKDGKKIDTVDNKSVNYEVNNLKSNTIYGFKVAARYSNGEISKPVSINIRTKKR